MHHFTQDIRAYVTDSNEFRVINVLQCTENRLNFVIPHSSSTYRYGIASYDMLTHSHSLKPYCMVDVERFYL